MSEPKRWKEADSEVDAELRAVLRDAARRAPSAAQVARFAAHVKSTLVAASVASAPPERTASARSAYAGLELPTWSALTLAIVVALVALWSRATPARQPKTRTDAPRAASQDAGLSPEPPRPAKSAAAASSAVSRAPTSREPRALRALRRADAPHTKAPVNVQAAVQAHEQDEIRLLQRAHRLVSTEPAAALRELRAHERDYPEGAFREEREALFIELLARSGQHGAMRQRALDFSSRYPDSAYRARLAPFLERFSPQ